MTFEEFVSAQRGDVFIPQKRSPSHHDHWVVSENRGGGPKGGHCLLVKQMGVRNSIPTAIFMIPHKKGGVGKIIKSDGRLFGPLRGHAVRLQKMPRRQGEGIGQIEMVATAS